MIDRATLEARLRELRPATDEAEVAMIVQRLRDEGRSTPMFAELDPERGLVGDRWALGKKRLVAQITVMRWDVASLLTPTPELLGDNLFAAIDTSAANLPPGAIVTVGPARCVVTPEPHTGCKKFAARAGADALAVTQAPAWKQHQLRGVHLQVLEGGVVRLGDRIRVVSRPA